MTFKHFILKITPQPVLNLYGKVHSYFLHKRNKTRSTQDVFSDIYERNVWGGEAGEFFSGTGSLGEASEKYVAFINRFISELDPPIRIVDLGCGDFRIGRRLVNESVDYVGVDVVPKLIERNTKEFSRANVSFQCLDIVTDELPDGDVCLIRQVLQHLSNDQIRRILPKLRKYRYVFVTEHYPEQEEGVVPNKDKPHGEDIRLSMHSAVYLDKPPFDVPVETVLTVPLKGGKLKTLLLKGRV